MNREEQIKAAIVVTPEAIAFTSPELNLASQRLAGELCNFIDYLQRLFPELDRSEATLLTSVVLEALPGLFDEVPEITEQLRECAAKVVNRRKG